MEQFQPSLVHITYNLGENNTFEGGKKETFTNNAKMAHISDE